MPRIETYTVSRRHHATTYRFGSSAPATNESFPILHIWYTLMRNSGHVLTRQYASVAVDYEMPRPPRHACQAIPPRCSPHDDTSRRQDSGGFIRCTGPTGARSVPGRTVALLTERAVVSLHSMSPRRDRSALRESAAPLSRPRGTCRVRARSREGVNPQGRPRPHPVGEATP